MSNRRIAVTEREHFAFNFIGNHDGKGIPMPLPAPVKSLEKKGLITFGAFLRSDQKTRCFLTPLGQLCFIKPN